MSTVTAFEEVADGVFVAHQPRFALNIGLVVGAEHGLLIDTGETRAQGEALRTALRRITALPLIVVNTHGHHDHTFGNEVFADVPIWAHRGCATMLSATGEQQRQTMIEAAIDEDQPHLAEALRAVRIRLPDHLVDDDGAGVVIELGDRPVLLRHLGRGHTDHDLIVEVPASALFAGDLVEQGAPPDFGDAFPLDWPATARAVYHRSAAHPGAPVVPGHGRCVDAAFVAEQAALLDTVAFAAQQGFAQGAGAEVAARGLTSLPDAVARQAVDRAYLQLQRAGPSAH